MGNRTNWGFVQEMGAPVLNLYGHWAGSNRRELLAKGLAEAKSRWSDPGYATRIVMSQIIGDEWNQPNSWGVYVDQLSDNENPYLMVFWEPKIVVEIPLTWEDTGKSGLEKVWTLAPQATTWTLEEFVESFSPQRVG